MINMIDILYSRLSERVNELTGSEDLPLAGRLEDMPNKGKGRPKLKKKKKLSG